MTSTGRIAQRLVEKVVTIPSNHGCLRRDKEERVDLEDPKGKQPIHGDRTKRGRI